jgi:hypothetical protein
LAAYTVGLEVEVGLCKALGRRHYNAGWHPTGMKDCPIRGAAVQIWTRSGVRSLKVTVPQWHCRVGLARDVARERLKGCTAGVLDSDFATEAFKQIEGISSSSDVGLLISKWF